MSILSVVLYVLWEIWENLVNNWEQNERFESNFEFWMSEQRSFYWKLWFWKKSSNLRGFWEFWEELMREFASFEMLLLEILTVNIQLYSNFEIIE